jgi:hypothetical protein
MPRVGSACTNTTTDGRPHYEMGRRVDGTDTEVQLLTERESTRKGMAHLPSPFSLRMGR